MGPVSPARPFVVGGAEAWAVLLPRGAARARELREAVADGAEACLWLCIVVFLLFLRFQWAVA